MTTSRRSFFRTLLGAAVAPVAVKLAAQAPAAAPEPVNFSGFMQEVKPTHTAGYLRVHETSEPLVESPWMAYNPMHQVPQVKSVPVVDTDMRLRCWTSIKSDDRYCAMMLCDDGKLYGLE